MNVCSGRKEKRERGVFAPKGKSSLLFRNRLAQMATNGLAEYTGTLFFLFLFLFSRGRPVCYFWCPALSLFFSLVGHPLPSPPPPPPHGHCTWALVLLLFLCCFFCFTELLSPVLTLTGDIVRALQIEEGRGEGKNGEGAMDDCYYYTRQ